MTRPTVEPAGVSPMRIDVEPSSLYITHICDGEEVVRGGEDGQVYIATFCSYYMAHFFVGQCNQLAGFVSGTIAPTSQPSRGKNPHCPADGKPCAPDGKGECVACDDGKGDCAQPERQPKVYTHGLTLTPADIAEITGVPLKPSPPQDDIVAGLRDCLIRSKPEGDEAIVPIKLWESAIAALERR